MKEAPTPADEKKRLASLRSLKLLDSSNEERFDRITRLAQQSLQVPIALVSLVDEKRQWFKSKVGIEATETERCISFCGHTIMKDDIFVVENALLDDRFVDNPLVTGELGLRFYAGRPIHAPNGMRIGTLCVIDTEPRQFDEKQRRHLDDLAHLVEREVSQTEDRRKIRDSKRPTSKQNSYKNIINILGSKSGAFLTAFAVAVGVILIAYAWHQKNIDAFQTSRNASAIESLANIRGKIETELNSRLYLTQAIAGLVRTNDNIANEVFQRYADELGKKQTSVSSLQLAPNGIVSLVWPYEEHQGAIGHDLMGDPARRKAAQKAIDSRHIWLAGPVTLMQGGVALIGRLPIFVADESAPSNERFWGFATILIDFPAFIEEVGLNDEKFKSIIAIRGKDGEGKLGELFFGSEESISHRIASTEVSLPAGSWELSIQSSEDVTRWPGQEMFWLLTVLALLSVPTIVYVLLRLPSQFQLAVKAAKEALEKSDIRFRDAIEALDDGFVIYDEADNLLTCNERYRDLYSTSREVIQEGRSFQEIIEFGTNRGQFNLSEHAVKNNDEYIKQRLEQHRDSTKVIEEQLDSGRWLRVVERPIRGGGIVGLRVDITELKLKEQELALARDNAEAANKAKSLFLATVSHEVRTPMNVILGLLEILKSATGMTTDENKYVVTAHQSAKQLLLILNEILDISKIEAGKFELDMSVFDLNEVLEDVINFSTNAAKDKNLIITPLIKIDKGTCFKGDKGRLQQVLLNIITNAIKFTDHGEIGLNVKVISTQDEQSEVQFTVKDSGIGFPQEKSELIFEPFSQLDNGADRRHEGTGLGLAICKKLVDFMGGNIIASSELGQGAEFTFTILLSHAETIISSPNESLLRKKNRRPSGEKIRILIAEDSPSNQIVFKAMLSDTNYEVDIVDNGEEATLALKRKAYDILFMDIYMPVMDGITATKKIRADNESQAIPIVALTANAMKGDRERFLDAGMDDYVPKPIDKELLLSKILEWSGK